MLREELGNAGMTVTALQPGATDTNFVHRADMDDTKAATDARDDPALDRRMIAQARVEGIPVLTRDRAFAAYGIEVLWD